MSERHCKTCAFWGAIEYDGGRHCCHMNPPSCPNEFSIGEWPQTEAGEWCGEWRQAESAAGRGLDWPKCHVCGQPLVINSLDTRIVMDEKPEQRITLRCENLSCPARGNVWEFAE
jgi:hypothetical protein